VIISTKFGIVPAKQTLWKKVAKPVARTLMRRVPDLAKQFRAQAASQFQPGQFSTVTLRDSVATSLRKLRTDYLDVLFLHGASLEAIHDEELLSAMEELVLAGKVRVIGVSAELSVAAAALGLPGVQAIQFPCHADNGFAQPLSGSSGLRHVLSFANHPFGGVQGVASLQAKLSAIADQPEFPHALQEKLLAGDCASLTADVILSCALTRSDLVLATMMKLPHLQANAAAVSQSRFEPAEIMHLRSWFEERPECSA
jgi:diketogulonate reductase-like aldo/keto reductase